MADNEWVDVSHELQNSNDGWEDVSHELRPEHKLDSALEGVAQGLTANYANNLRAAAQKPIFAVLNALTGQDVEPDDYVKARDSFNRNTKALQE